MITVDLKNFLYTGRFGNIDLGMNKAQVEQSIGKPDYWMMTHFSRNEKENSPIWRYGNIEFHFDVNRKLVSIYNDHLVNAGIYGGVNIKLDCWVLLKENQKLVTIENQLDKEGFFYSKEYITKEEPSKIKVNLQSGVDLLFTSEKEDYTVIKGTANYLLYGFELCQNILHFLDEDNSDLDFSIK